MVWPLVALAAGYGLQAYGADQRTQALKNALSQYQQYLNVINAEQTRHDATLQKDLGSIAQSYDRDVASLVNSYNPQARTGAFAEGKQAGLSGIQQALGTVNAANPIAAGGKAANPVFNAAFADAQGRANTRTAQLADSVANTQGIDAMGQRENRLSAVFADRGMQHAQRMQDALRVYQLGDALRQQALARASGQQGIDMQRAQNAGAAAMLAGGLVSGAGQVGSTYWGQSAYDQQHPT